MLVESRDFSLMRSKHPGYSLELGLPKASRIFKFVSVSSKHDITLVVFHEHLGRSIFLPVIIH